MLLYEGLALSAFNHVHVHICWIQWSKFIGKRRYDLGLLMAPVHWPPNQV